MKEINSEYSSEGLVLKLNPQYFGHLMQRANSLEISHLNFPGDTADKNLPTSVGDMGSIPGPGRFHMPQGNKAHAPQILRLTCLKSMLCNKRSPGTTTGEQPLLAPTRESPRTAMKTQHSTENNEK